MRTITAKAVIKALTKFFSMFEFGLPKVLQTDQGTNFTSKLFIQSLSSLGVTLCTSIAYHPESQGALERFHQILKAMLKKYCFDTGNQWDEGIPFVLFAAHETRQKSLKFSPAELGFGHMVQGLLKVLKERMLGVRDGLSPKTNVLDYVTRFRHRIYEACAQLFLSKAQVDIKNHFDKDAVNRSFTVGDKVLVLLRFCA